MPRSPEERYPWKYGITFRRAPFGYHGEVILGIDGIEFTISPSEWGNIVAHVSMFGDVSDAFSRAIKLHMGIPDA